MRTFWRWIRRETLRGSAPAPPWRPAVGVTPAACSAACRRLRPRESPSCVHEKYWCLHSKEKTYGHARISASIQPGTPEHSDSGSWSCRRTLPVSVLSSTSVCSKPVPAAALAV